MKAQINLITIITKNIIEMTKFYHELLDFPIEFKMDQYLEFKMEGVRLALTTNEVMSKATNHRSFLKEKKGQSFELAFPLPNPNDVDQTYGELVQKGVQGIKEPENMPWGQRTAFFADPDGNIHEIFAYLPKS